MLNEEIQKFESLTGKNANEFSIAYVGGYLDGYEKGKETAPAADPSFITNISDVQNWTVCGYRVEELITLALILRKKSIDDYNLSDFNGAFTLGYKRATEDFNKSIDEAISKIINDDKEAANNE